VTLYNINIQNINIKKIFIKIDKDKLITLIDINKIFPINNKIELNQIISYLKALKHFKQLKIKAKQFLISYNDNILIVKNPDLELKAKIKNELLKTHIFIQNLNYKNFNLKNINLTLKDYLNYFYLNGIINYKNSIILLEGKLYPLSNNIDIKLNSPKINIKNNLFSIKSLKTKIKINLNKNTVVSTTHILSSEINYKKIPIKLNKIIITQNNQKFTAFIQNAQIKNYKGLKNITFNKINIISNLKNYYTFIKIKNSRGIYKNFLINSKNLNIKIPNKNTILLTIPKIKIFNKSYIINLNKIYAIKNEKLFYKIKSINFISNKIKANSSPIVGDEKKVINKIISGLFDEFNFSIKNNELNISNKILTSQKINLNNAKINNLQIDLTKKIATFNSKEYFDERINDILKKELNVDIPLKQIKGKNYINGKFSFDKNISFNVFVNSKKPVLKLLNFPLTAKEANVSINPTFTSFYANKSHLKINKKINLFFTGKGKVNYQPLILTLNGIIDQFVIDPILNIKNFKESAKMDLMSLELFLKNSHTYINFNKKNIIVNNLQPIIKFSPLNDLIKNGILYISFAKDIVILTYIKPSIPIFYKHNNKPITNINKLKEDKIMLNIRLKDNRIILYNNYIQFFMERNNIFLSLKNIDINLYPLEKFYYKHINSKNTKNKNIIINLENSNILFKNHKFLSQKAKITEINNSIKIASFYKNSTLKGYTKSKYFLLEGKNFSKEEINALIAKVDFFKQINADFTLVKSPENYYIGTIYINRAIVRELKALNNVVAFLNTIPAILSLSSPGFSSKGYKIKNGKIQYLLYNNILYLKRAKIIGENIDFISKGYIDFNKNYINLKTTAILKLKLKKIPILGKGLSYLFLGKDGNIKVNIIIKGNLENPEIKKDIGKALIPNPFDLFKRTLSLPFNIF
jgi:glutaredoxin-related protein